MAGGSDRTAQVWDARTFTPLGPPLTHPGEVLDVAYSPDGTMILTGSSDGMARLWDASTYQPVGRPLEHLGSVAAVAFSPDGKMLLTGGDDAHARFWEAKTGKPLGDPLPQPTEITRSGLQPRRQDRHCGRRHARPILGRGDAHGRGQAMPHHGTLTSVAFGPDGRAVVTGAEDNTARLWYVRHRTPAG